MLNRRSFFPSIIGGLSAAIAIPIPKPEAVGYQRLTVSTAAGPSYCPSMGAYSVCVRLAKSELSEYAAWLTSLCAFATLVKSVDETDPFGQRNAVSFAEARAVIKEPRRRAIDSAEYDEDFDE